MQRKHTVHMYLWLAVCTREIHFPIHKNGQTHTFTLNAEVIKYTYNVCTIRGIPGQLTHSLIPRLPCRREPGDQANLHIDLAHQVGGGSNILMPLYIHHYSHNNGLGLHSNIIITSSLFPDAPQCEQAIYRRIRPSCLTRLAHSCLAITLYCTYTL